MDQTLHIWHNPRCSKSRQTLELLKHSGYAPQVRHYLDNPPNSEELRQALDALGLRPSQLLRKGECQYAELKLDKADEASCFAAMLQHPILIERPVVMYRGKAELGRPPEQITKLL